MCSLWLVSNQISCFTLNTLEVSQFLWSIQKWMAPRVNFFLSFKPEVTLIRLLVVTEDLASLNLFHQHIKWFFNISLNLARALNVTIICKSFSDYLIYVLFIYLTTNTTIYLLNCNSYPWSTVYMVYGCSINSVPSTTVFLKVGSVLRTASLENFSEMQIQRPHSRSTEPATREPSSLCFNKENFLMILLYDQVWETLF